MSKRIRPDAELTNQRAKAIDWGFAESSEKKTPYLWVEFLFLDGHGDNGEEVVIRKDFYLTDKNFEYVLRDLATMGWRGKSIFELERGPEGFDLGAKEVLLTTEMETYEGKLRAKVKFINDPDYIPAKPLEREMLRSIDAKLRGKIAAYRAQNKTPKTTAIQKPVFEEGDPTESKLPNVVITVRDVTQKEEGGIAVYRIYGSDNSVFVTTVEEHATEAKERKAQNKDLTVFYEEKNGVKTMLSFDIPF